MRIPRSAAVSLTALIIACGSDTSAPLVPTQIKVVAGGEQSGLVGATLPTPIVIQLVDDADRPIANVQVQFSVARVSADLQTVLAIEGSATPAAATTDAGGRAETAVTLGDTPGTYALVVEAVSLEARVELHATTPLPVVRVISGSAQQDTVGATLANPIVVEVRDPHGDLLPNATVIFRRSAGSDVVLIGFGDRELTEAPVITDALGRASVGVRLGRRAHTAWISATLQQPSTSDSARVTALPGTAVGLRVEPRDTAAMFGNTAQLRAVGVDAYGNPFPAAQAQFSSESPVIAVAPTGAITAVSFGRAVIRATSGAFSDSAFINSVPRGRVAGTFRTFQPPTTRVAFANLDGSDYRAHIAPVREVEWTPAGDSLVATSPYTQPHLTMMDTLLTGSRVIIPQFATSPGEYEPEFGADNRIYFTAVNAQNANEVWVTDRAGTTVERLAFGSSPSLAPDARQLAFLIARIIILDLETRVVRDPGVAAGHAKWSPTGEWIAYTRTAPNGVSLLDPVTGATTTLIDYQFSNPLMVEWSPDGKYLLIRMYMGETVVFDMQSRTWLTVPIHMESMRWKP